MRCCNPSTLHEIKGIVGEENGAGKSGLMFNGITGIIKISQGCAGKCSYCIVKKARGELVSRPIPEIVEEAESLISHGAKEIQLSSRDLSAYGLDTGKRLPELLDAIASIEGDYMVRVGMMNPFTVLDITEEIAEAFKNPRIFNFLHLPVQSGSDKVLEDMNRKHTVSDFRKIIHKFRDVLRDFTLSTDFIVGYPTETEQDFGYTCKLLDDIKPQKVNTTRYSPRPGTPAFELYDMPDRIKKERSRKITRKHHTINRELFRQMKGNRVGIIATEKGKNCSTVGRDSDYNIIVVRDSLKLGRWYDIKIIDSRNTYLVGELIEKH